MTQTPDNIVPITSDARSAAERFRAEHDSELLTILFTDRAEDGAFQPSLFDAQDLAEVTSDDYPGERLAVCYNPLPAEDRRRTRTEVLAATQARLEKIAVEVARRTKKPMTGDEIGVKVGKIINHHKVGKHFELTIE